MRCLLLSFAVLALTACPGGHEPAQDAGASQVDAGTLPAPLVWHEVVNTYAPGAVLSVWSSAPDNVWMVGGERDRGFALHFDGADWTVHDPGTGAQLWWVHGWDDGQVMVVGERGSAALWNGSAWRQLPTEAPGVVFYGLWGVAPTDVWAVGGTQPETEGDIAPQPDALYHYDGTSWRAVDVPPRFRQGEGSNLFKIWGLDAETMFIVGSYGRALHRTLDGWSDRTTPASQEVLFTLSGRAYDDVYAVGGMVSAVMIHWDGRVWNSVPMPEQSPTSLPGVWTAPGHGVYVAGARGFTARLDDGQWTTQWVDTAQSFHAIHHDGQRLWAVGGDIDARRADHLGAIFCSEVVSAP